MNKVLGLGILVAGMSLAACSGAGGAPLVTTAPASVPTSVSMPLAINGAALPPGSQSLTVQVNGGPIQTFEVNGPTVQTPVDAPVGTDTFVFTDYAGPNGTGKILATGTSVETVVQNTSNQFNITLTPTP
jgi:hypothetical protein